MNDVGELEYLEARVNNYRLIERQPIKLLFASDNTLRKFKENPELINSDLFIDSDITMLGLDAFGNKKELSTADGVEVSNNKGILLIEAKDITNALLDRLNSIANNSYDDDMSVRGIVDKRLENVKKKLEGSVKLLNILLKPIGKTLSENTNICVGLFIDYKLTAVDEFGLTGDIGLLRQEIDEYSETINETVIFTNRYIKKMEKLINEYKIVNK